MVPIVTLVYTHPEAVFDWVGLSAIVGACLWKVVRDAIG